MNRRKLYQRIMAKAHPDKGGDHETAAAATAAYRVGDDGALRDIAVRLGIAEPRKIPRVFPHGDRKFDEGVFGETENAPPPKKDSGVKLFCFFVLFLPVSSGALLVFFDMPPLLSLVLVSAASFAAKFPVDWGE